MPDPLTSACTPPLSASAAVRLAELIGPEYVITDAALCAPYEVDGILPSAIVRPHATAEIAEILRFAGAEGLAVIPTGGRTKLGLGMPPRRYDLALDLSRMNRVLAYDPRDLTLGVEPAVRFSDLDPQLRAERQFLPLASSFAGRATLGGMVASGADSPWRCGYGGARDYLLGLEFVTGEGIPSKSGGRVVKNVTGYDLHKLLIGSLGTLAVITRLNFRTFPVPPAQQTFVASFASAEDALNLSASIANSPLQPKILDIVDSEMASLLAARGAVSLRSDAWSVVITTAGQPVVVERCARDLAQLAGQEHATDFAELDASAEATIIATVSDFAQAVLDVVSSTAIFRIAALPSAIPDLLQEARAVAQRHELREAALVRASSIVYVAFLPQELRTGRDVNPLASACMQLMETAITKGLRPMIEWCPLALKRVWESSSKSSIWAPVGDEQEIAGRLKNVFDPRRTLAPGRFAGGI